jgi:hypothetical protein
MVLMKVEIDRVNLPIAAEVADYLYRMVMGNLKGFSTYFDFESGGRDRFILRSSWCVGR